MDIGELADGGDGIAVLGEAHGPAGDQFAFALEDGVDEFLNFAVGDAGVAGEFVAVGLLAELAIIL